MALSRLGRQQWLSIKDDCLIIVNIIQTLYMNNIFEVIDELYDKSGYTDRYGFDIWMSFFLCVVFFIAISYYHVKNNLEPIKADWTRQRCKPHVIPFAGIINKGPQETIFEYTERNFNECTQSILASISDEAFKPFYYLLSVIANVFRELTNSINSIRAQFDHVRTSIAIFAEEIMGRVLNITIPIVTLFITTKSILNKVIGTISATIYAFIGSYFGLKSFMAFFMGLIIKILYGLVGTITGLWVASAFLPMLVPTAITTTAVMSAILIPTIIIQVLMSDVMELSSDTPPSVPPACFAGNTKVLMNDNCVKNISDICVGDTLKDGSKVTSTMILTSEEQEMYCLDGVVVTGEHSIYHENLGWISVKNHPESVVVESFMDPYLYCINTDTKCIKIGEQIYSDWDDLEDDELDSLSQNQHVPRNITLRDIHRYFDSGFLGNTQMKLHNGEERSISQLKVNDILEQGQRVCGIVKVDCQDIASGVNVYHLDDSIVTCTSNIIVIAKEKATKKPIRVSIANHEPERPNIVYHILTDTGSFTIQGFRFGDYNTSIENYL